MNSDGDNRRKHDGAAKPCTQQTRRHEGQQNGCRKFQCAGDEVEPVRVPPTPIFGGRGAQSEDVDHASQDIKKAASAQARIRFQ
jgi:hypothetical protein